MGWREAIPDDPMENIVLCCRIFLQSQGRMADDLTDCHAIWGAVNSPEWKLEMVRIGGEVSQTWGHHLMSIAVHQSLPRFDVWHKCFPSDEQSLAIPLVRDEHISPHRNPPFRRAIVHQGKCFSCGRSLIVITPTPCENVIKVNWMEGGNGMA